MLIHISNRKEGKVGKEHLKDGSISQLAWLVTYLFTVFTK